MRCTKPAPVAINGVVEALKADALDFLWRAREAIVQGLFLRVLGVSVLGNRLVRFQSGYEPEAELMGTFACIALGVIVAATLVLIPHRMGDTNVRVWLFSRNDAIGNLAVVIATGLVSNSLVRRCNRPGHFRTGPALGSVDHHGCPVRSPQGRRREVATDPAVQELLASL